MKLSLVCAFSCALLSSAAQAQDTLYISDVSLDRIVACRDVAADGSLNEAGDVTLFYDGATGPILMSNAIGITNGPGATQYACDTSIDVVAALTDLNANGDAMDAGEALIYFDGRAGGNAQGLLLGAAGCVHFQASTNKVWIATANQGTSTLDQVLVVGDNNNDGDANDAGESAQFWVGSSTSYLPQALFIDAGGRVFVTEIGSVFAKGVYELVDVNLDGDASDPGEFIPFFLLPSTPTPFAWSLEQDAQGWFYLPDTGGDILYRFKDLNVDGDAMDAGESTPFFTSPTPNNSWDTAAAPGGVLYVSDGASPGRVYRLQDTSGDGIIGVGEWSLIYDQGAGNPVAIQNGRGIAVRTAVSPGTAYCSGDGTAAACPCANLGSSGNGCASSTFAAGANLAATGVAGASLATDTLALVATNMPGPGLFFQGSAQAAGGAGISFGDGLLCVSGSILRLGVVFPSGSTASYPGGLTPNPIHIGGATAPGDVRQYQCWYRDSASFCTASTFNLTQGLELIWGP